MRKVQHAIARLTQMDHVTSVPIGSGNYRVLHTVTDPLMQTIRVHESGDEHRQFLRAVKPVMNAQRLEPA